MPNFFSKLSCQFPMVGVLGFGKIGSAIVDRLVSQHYALMGYTRSRVACGSVINSVDAPTDVFREGQIIISALTDQEATKEVLSSVIATNASLLHNKVFLDFSTSSPAQTQFIADSLSQQGGMYFDVPISGSPDLIREGKGLLTVGGCSKQPSKIILRLLNSITSNIIYYDNIGDGMRAKLQINIATAICLLGYIDSIKYSISHGNNIKQSYNTILSSPISSVFLKNRAFNFTESKVAVKASINTLLKDLLLVANDNNGFNHSYMMLDQAIKVLEYFQELGHGEEDVASINLIIAENPDVLDCLFDSHKQVSYRL